MKEIPLTKGKFASVDDEDFEVINQFKWFALGAGNDLFYAGRRVKGKTIFMHRFIMGVYDSKVIIDHIDHNCLNNQRNNLRECTHSQNLLNSRKVKKSALSKFHGVSYDKAISKWVAQIWNNGKYKKIGSYQNEIDAAIAYNAQSSELHGEFAKINIVP